MCNYVTGFSVQPRSGAWPESLTLGGSLELSTFSAGFEDEDDNRGSGR